LVDRPDLVIPRDRKEELRWGGFALLVTLAIALDAGSGGTPFFRDRMYYFAPQYESCRTAIAAGEIPLWNPRVNCGTPLLAAWQMGLLSPLSLPFLALSFAEAVRIFWILALGTASAGAFALGIVSGLSPFGAAVAAITYSAAGPLRTLGEWPNIVASLAYLPGLLAALATAVQGRRSALVTAALFGAFTVLSGQPRQIIIVSVSAAAWLAALRAPRRIWYALAGILLLAALLSAAQLLPSFELFLRSDRRSYGVVASTVAESFLNPADLLTLISARFWGNEHAAFGDNRLLMPSLYLGILGSWLLVRGVSGARPGNAIRRYSLIAIPVCLALAIFRPVHQLAGVLHGETAFLRYMGHMILAALPAVALSVGAGAERLANDGRSRPFWPVAALALSLGLFTPAGRLVAFLCWNGGMDQLARVRTDLMLSAAVLLTACLALRHPFALRRPVLALLVAGDLFLPLRGYEAKAVGDFFSPPPVAARVRAGRLFSPPWLTPVYPDRIGSVQLHYRARIDVLAPNTPTFWGISNALGYEPFFLAVHRELFGGWDDDLASVRDALQACGVRWLAGPVSRAEIGWKKIRAIAPGWALWENPDPLPVARILPASAEVPANRWRKLAAFPPCGSADVLRETNNQLDLSVSSAPTNLLVVATPRYPGWRASIDGIRTPMRTAGFFQAVSLTGGRSSVSLSYEPVSFKIGLLAGTVTVVFLVVLGLIALAPDRNRFTR
jgi:hypothetical protein